MQVRYQNFFRAGKGDLWSWGTLINILSKTQEKQTPQRKILDFFLLDTLKATF